MCKNFRLSASLISLLLMLIMVFALASCGGGGGDGGTGTQLPPDSTNDGPSSNASAVGDDELRVVAGYATFTPPIDPVMITKNTSRLDNYGKTLAVVPGVSWISQIPPCNNLDGTANWDDTANCGAASYLMVEAFYKGYDINSTNAEEGIKGIIDWLATNAGNDAPAYLSPWRAGIEYYCGDVPTDSHLAKLAKMRGGFASKAIIGASADILLQELKRGYPTIVRVLSQGKNNTERMIVSEKNKCLGHYMLLTGMDSTWVYVNDPGRAYEQDGKKRYTLDSFIEVWGTPHCEDPSLYNRAIILAPKVGIVFSSLSLPIGKVNEQYDAVLSALDGLLPYNWSVINGSLPSGLYLTSDGRVTGTPTVVGDFPLTIRVIDSANDVAEAKISISISSSAVITPLAITMPRELPMRQMGISYDIMLSIAGGIYPYKWSLMGGSMPNGLSLTMDGRIIGIPTNSGTYIFNVQVTDSGLIPQTTSKELAVTILPSNNGPIISSVTINPLTISTGTPSTLSCNAFDPDGDIMTYLWTKTGGDITGSGSTVTWTAPATVGTYAVTCSVSDGKGGTASKGVNISVAAAAATFSIAPGSQSVSEAGVSATFTVTRSNGAAAQTVYASTVQTEGYINNSDYSPVDNRLLSFAVGETSKIVTVTITNDAVVEPNEVFGLIVQQNSTDPAATYLAKATFTIVNND